MTQAGHNKQCNSVSGFLVDSFHSSKRYPCRASSPAAYIRITRHFEQKKPVEPIIYAVHNGGWKQFYIYSF